MGSIRAVVAGVVLALLAGCSDSGPDSDSGSVVVATPALTLSGSIEASLPPGALVELVPTVAELPAGFAPIEGGAGPLDLSALADLSADAESAAADLEREGFRDGYTSQFADEASGTFVSVMVTRFHDASGAGAHLAREKRESSSGTEPLAISPVGEESFAIREKLSEGDVSEIATIFFRVGNLVWLVETSGPSAADSALAQAVAAQLARRIS